MSEHADADAHAHAPHDELLRTSALQQTLTPPEVKPRDEAAGEPPTAFYNDTIAIINAFAEDIEDVECDDADGTAAAGKSQSSKPIEDEKKEKKEKKPTQITRSTRLPRGVPVAVYKEGNVEGTDDGMDEVKKDADTASRKRLSTDESKTQAKRGPRGPYKKRIKPNESETKVKGGRRTKAKRKHKEAEGKEVGGDEESEEEVFEVKTILDKRVDVAGRVEFYVAWNGYPRKEDNSWEPKGNLDQCEDKLLEFEAKLLKKKSLRTLRDVKTVLDCRTYADGAREYEVRWAGSRVTDWQPAEALRHAGGLIVAFHNAHPQQPEEQHQVSPPQSPRAHIAHQHSPHQTAGAPEVDEHSQPDSEPQSQPGMADILLAFRISETELRLGTADGALPEAQASQRPAEAEQPGQDGQPGVEDPPMQDVDGGVQAAGGVHLASQDPLAEPPQDHEEAMPGAATC
mmetsp:Transcript_17083/g.28806  ORF Transcript_17083/g.28806 Transcript_17083/m.28806 type:complete len:457 (+) Transcript_17083:168-1538(+)|eukprot:CAMPEP_0198217356 /NCGR_PEP_ID=MMETSP1445-20131203/63151_1 /TAXON_ID=36898 /ORGANISM="Pyramimonas sp., Strain CCMP2087" /LENGTH=456 /DNA_ID=CAMNT_0043894015 /DNA_START=72 /DNA_END=1442 /DNA_ORIENTATION=-